MISDNVLDLSGDWDGGREEGEEEENYCLPEIRVDCDHDDHRLDGGYRQSSQVRTDGPSPLEMCVYHIFPVEKADVGVQNTKIREATAD